MFSDYLRFSSELLAGRHQCLKNIEYIIKTLSPNPHPIKNVSAEKMFYQLFLQKHLLFSHFWGGIHQKLSSKDWS